MSDNEWPDNEPLSRALRLAARGWWQSFVICMQCHGPWDDHRTKRDGRGYHVQPWWAVVLGLPISIAFASLQAYGYVGLRKGWPQWPWDFFGGIHAKLSDLVEAHTTNYVWLPADSGDPHEVAFHCRREEVEYVRDDDWTRRCVKRPRMYCYAPVTPTIPDGQHTATAGSGYTYMLKIDAEVPHA